LGGEKKKTSGMCEEGLLGKAGRGKKKDEQGKGQSPNLKMKILNESAKKKIKNEGGKRSPPCSRPKARQGG